jgi:hypothetical protein
MSGSEKISAQHEHEIHLSPVVKLLQHLSESSVRQDAEWSMMLNKPTSK